MDAAAPLEWFAALGLYTRTDEAGRVYPYSNQAADVLALLEGHLARLGVEVRTGCTVQTLSQNRSGYTILCEDAEGQDQTLRADAVICAMGGNAGPQFGTDGFGTRFAAQCGGKLEPLYPCLTALQTAKPNRSLAGIRAKAAATLLDLDRHCTVAVENGEVQFTDYGLSGICIMQLSGHLAPGRGPKRPAVELDLFPMLDETALTALFAARVPLLPGKAPADFWTGLLNPKLGRALWAAAKLPEKPVDTLPDAAWQVLANAAKHWLFEGLTPCGWKQVDMLPRHPAQLYEAIAYFIFFLIMIFLYKNYSKKLHRGFFFGLCLTEIFVFRFFVEFLKENQVDFENSMSLNMGQWLSVPFVIIGVYFMFFYGKKKA